MVEPYYDRDGITIYRGDCREIVPTLEPVDLVLTDPPYGYGWDTSYSRFSKGSADKPEITSDAERMDLDWLWELKCELMFFGANSIGHTDPGSYLVWDKRCGDGWSFLSDAEVAWWSEGHGVYIYPCNAQKHRSKSGLHPTQKPVEVMTWMISKAKQSGTILDPFMGSGTTLVAAKLEGRSAIGIEIEERYCEIAANRLSQGFLF